MQKSKSEAVAGRALSDFRRRFDGGPALLLGATATLAVLMGVVVATSGSSLLGQSRETEALLRERMARGRDQDRIELRQAAPLRAMASEGAAIKDGAARAASQSRE